MKNPTRQWSASPKQLVAVVALIVALYFIAGVLSRGLNLWSLKQQQHALEQQQQQLIQKSNQLQDDITYMGSDSYIEQAARAMLLWVRPGENLIVTTNDAVPPTPVPVPTRRP